MTPHPDLSMDALKQRHSVRAYLPRPIEVEKLEQLNAMASRLNAEAGICMQIVTDNPDTFGKSLWNHYGKFTGVSNFIALVGPKKADEALGYYGEMLVLKAQELGLNTCWVGLTYNKRRTPVDIPAGMKLHAVIALGYGATQGVQHKSREPKAVSSSKETPPQWFIDGVDCALLAPTAMNQQKFHFTLRHDGSIEATHGLGFYAKMDLGIAKLHFEIGSGKKL